MLLPPAPPRLSRRPRRRPPRPLPSAPDTGAAAATAAGSTASSGGHSSTAKDDSNGDRAAGNPAPGPAPAAGTAAPVATSQSAPVTAPAPSAAPAATAATAPTAYGVRLAEAAEKVANTIAMGARDGISMARIELSPESLGAIQIHLQHTPDGLIARVVTEHPEAAQTLSQGGDDLKRQLQQNGATLLRLDIESSGQQRSGRDGQAGVDVGLRMARAQIRAQTARTPTPRRPPTPPCKPFRAPRS